MYVIKCQLVEWPTRGYNNSMDKNSESSNTNYQFPPSSEIGVNLNDDNYVGNLEAGDELYQILADESKRLKEAEKNAFKDSLTNCYNRNYFESFSDNNIDPKRDNKKIAIVFIDLNDLKKANKEGYEVGDGLLIKAAEFLKTNFRKDDVVIRIGGDEFIVVCRDYKNDSDFEEKFSHRVDEIFLSPPISFAHAVTIYDTSQDTSLRDTKDRAGKMMAENKEKMKNAAQI